LAVSDEREHATIDVSSAAMSAIPKNRREIIQARASDRDARRLSGHVLQLLKAACGAFST
jgi:hypothetical protein